MKPLVYLACPYSHDDPDVRRGRFEAANLAGGLLMQQGVLVFSPISHGHPMALEVELPTHWEYWEAFCRAYLSHSHKILVLTLDGWDTSKGVAAELAIAKELGLVVEFKNPKEIT